MIIALGFLNIICSSNDNVRYIKCSNGQKETTTNGRAGKTK